MTLHKEALVRSSALLTLVLSVALTSPAAPQQARPSGASQTHPFVPLASLRGADVGRIAVDPRDPAAIYCGLNGGGGMIARSADGGATWSVIQVGGVNEEFRAIAVDPVDSAILFAFSASIPDGGATGGLYLSTDRGAHWNRLAHQPLGEQGHAGLGRGLVIDRRGTTLVIADRRQGVFRSADLGRTWTNPLPGSQAQTFGMYTDPNHPKTLWTAGFDSTNPGAAAAWVSHDFGLSWVKSAIPILDSSLRPLPTQLAVQPATGKILIGWNGFDPATFAIHGGVLASEDGGNSWFDSSNGIAEAVPLRGWTSGPSMVFDPASPDVVLAGSNGDLALRSIDGGVNWTRVPTPKNANGPYFYTFNVDAAGQEGVTILGGGVSSFFESGDSGVSWVRRDLNLDALGAYQILEVGGNEDDGSNGVGVYALSGFGSLSRSQDGGKSWRRIDPADTGNEITAAAIDVVAPDHPIYAVTHPNAESPTELWQSFDTGRTWSKPRLILPPGPLSRFFLVPDPTRAGRLYGMYTTDSFFSSAAGLRSDDRGAHWTPFTIGYDGDFPGLFTTPIVADPENSGTLYAAMASGLWKSTDAGSSWALLPQLPLGAYGIAGLAVSGHAVYVVAGADDGTFSLQKSSDGGTSWSAIASALGTVPYELAALPGGRLVAYQTLFEFYFGYSCYPLQVVQSTDGGLNWLPIDTASIASQFTTGSCVAVMPTATHLYVGDPYGSQRTLGARWSDLAAP